MLTRAFDIASSGLTAQRTRMEVVASNLANAQTTRTPEGGPYRRQEPVFRSEAVHGKFGDLVGQAVRSVRVQRIAEDPSPPILKFEPGHPDADPRGFVAYPNIQPVQEMVNMLSATRSYEANVTLINGVRTMGRAALEIVR
ncbi:flagellar basal body rod protein FlgC [Acidobacteria bacterium Mor1]|nr:flagellar basal body rod protein FlgC [Acidobacteria bacterium Mor1]